MNTTKRCEQCQIEKDITCFYRRPNKNDAEKRIKICIDCYRANFAESKRQVETRQQQWQMEQQRRIAQQEAERHARQQEEDQKRLALRQELESWYQQQSDRLCIDCKQVLPASSFGYTYLDKVDETYLPQLHKRCKTCHAEYRKQSKQVNPLCPMCNLPTPVNDFLQTYQGCGLDLIKVCCTHCIPRFEALPVPEQLLSLRQAMVKAYGETADIYALQYNDQFPCQHIGRTKHYTRRMAEYKRRSDWRGDVQRHFILQHLSFGPLSMEYESRWMLYALKCGWPIDNFKITNIGEESPNGWFTPPELNEVLRGIDPLFAPFEKVQVLIHTYFSNTGDTDIVHWYCSQQDQYTYPSEEEMRQRIALMEQLHRLRKL